MRNAPAPSTPPPGSIPRRDRPRESRPKAPAAAEAELLGVTRVEAAFPTRPRIVSTAHGPLRHLLLWYPPHDPGGPFVFRAAYGDLLRTLPASTEVTVVCHPSVADELEALVGATRPPAATTRIVLTPPSVGFTVWAEDAFVVVEDVGSNPPVTYLLEPERFPRAGDFQLAELVATATPLETTQSPLIFQGGNVLIGDDFVLVGVDYLDDSIRAVEESGAVEGYPYEGTAQEKRRFVANLFRQSFDPARQIHFLASTPRNRPMNRFIELDGKRLLDDVEAGRGARQPIFHIDMFVTLAGRGSDGRYRLLVGDPVLADRLLGWDPVPHDLRTEYDDIAAQLARSGFAVTRTPLPYVSVVESDAAVRTWYQATTNNCLVVVDGAAGAVGRRVWLPTYGHPPFEELAATDADHRRRWESMGFGVTQLGDFHPFAMRMGALHCIKKYLAR
ncbi:MAG: hypothetical protein QOD63_1985 [Actinomycetota bacterium]|nr:hypothetical protein [Actinomycetota bacterium]